mgnify:CR=1 FL=1
MNIRLSRSQPIQVTQVIPRRSAVTQILFSFFVVLVMNQVYAAEKDPNRCIDRVKVYVNDETQTFFSKMIIDGLQSRLQDIDSLSTAKLTEEQKERKEKWKKLNREGESETGVEKIAKTVKQKKEIEIRTSWKGGVKDLVFIDGGHSEETVASDWENVKHLLHEKSVVYFDDYPNWGIGPVVDGIDSGLWDIEVMEIEDEFLADGQFGSEVKGERMKFKFARVKPL